METLCYFYHPDPSIWLSVDPMSDKYPNLTPYAYCANNPIILVDPDGRDIWELDDLGQVIKHTSTTEYDKFIINGKEEIFNYGTIISTRSEKALYTKRNEDGTKEQAVTNVDIYKVRGDDNAKRLFEFVATKNTSVEWGHIKTGIKGDRGLNFLTTGHIEYTEPGINTIISGQLQYHYTIREINHSHPNNTAIPSGIPGLTDKTGTGKTGDVPSAKNITDWYTRKYPQRSSSPKFNIFFPGTGEYVPYSKDSKASDFGY